MWNADTGKLEHTYEDMMPNSVTACCLDDRRRKLILGDSSGLVRVFNCTNAAPMKDMERHDTEITALAYCSQLEDEHHVRNMPHSVRRYMLSAAKDGQMFVQNENDQSKGVKLPRMMTAPYRPL